MASERVVRGQRVTAVKAERARELRRHMTPQEKTLWNYLRDHRMAGRHFRRQQVISGFIADFYCHAAALVVEVDGPIHQANPQYDEERDAVFAQRGIRVLRFGNEEVQNDLFSVLARIEAECLRSVCDNCAD